MVLVAFFTDRYIQTHTETYGLKSSTFTLRTVTNSFTFKALNITRDRELQSDLYSFKARCR